MADPLPKLLYGLFSPVHALATFMTRQGTGKETIRKEIADRFGYDLDRTVNGIRSTYSFDVSWQGSVPESIVAFLDSEDYETAVRYAISLGGDVDTMACIVGGIAQAFSKTIPAWIVQEVREKLTADLLAVVDDSVNHSRVNIEPVICHISLYCQFGLMALAFDLCNCKIFYIFGFINYFY